MKRQIVQAFAELRARGKEPNFIFSGDSVLHLASFNAFVRYMNEHGIRLCGVVCNGIPGNRTKQFDESSVQGIDPENFIYLENGRDVDLREYPSETISDSVKLFCSLLRMPDVLAQDSNDLSVLTDHAGSKFFILFPGTNRLKEHFWNEALIFHKTPVRVVLEEGLGTYHADPRAWFDISIAKTRSFLGRLLKYARWHIMSPMRNVVDGLLAKKTMLARFCTFNFDQKGDLEINQDVVRNLASVFQLTAQRQGVRERDFANKIIIATTVLFEEASKQSLETEVFSSVIEMCRDNGIEVVIKPHPRDVNLDKYRILGAEVIEEENLSMESMLAASSNKPIAVLGLLSTSQVLAKALWNIDAIFLAGLSTKLFDDGVGARVKQFADFYLKDKSLFASFASSPQSYNELEALLFELAKKSSAPKA